MASKKYKPRTPGFRHRRVVDYSGVLTTDVPEKTLCFGTSKTSGRGAGGKVSVRTRGGGNKRLYRCVDFLRRKDAVPAVVKTIEYDPFRTSFISLVFYKDGEKRYIISPVGLEVGDTIVSGDSVEISTGNCMMLKHIPLGMQVHNVELSLGKGGVLVRSAGSYAVVMGKHEGYVTIKLPSGSMRLVHERCRATIGVVGNLDNRNTVSGKAGASFWKRRKPRVRGSVMNRCCHPHGGGEGRAPVGHSSPRTPSGKPALGYKTRKKRRYSNKYIVGLKG